MLIIDIDKQKVHNNPHFDLDVVILKGASDDLVSSLTRLTLSPTRATEHGCCGVRNNSKKVALATRTERIGKAIPESVLAQGNGQFNHVFSQLSKILGGITTPENVSATYRASKSTRITLQKELAELLASNTSYVETLRSLVQSSSTMNPESHTVTTRNIQAAIALYACYSDDRSFSSTEGSAIISGVVQVSTDTIARLASELSMLRRTGVSAATRYFVSRTFGQLLIRILQQPKFAALLAQVDDIQNQIDGLGSL